MCNNYCISLNFSRKYFTITDSVLTKVVNLSCFLSLFQITYAVFLVAVITAVDMVCAGQLGGPSFGGGGYSGRPSPSYGAPGFGGYSGGGGSFGGGAGGYDGGQVWCKTQTSNFMLLRGPS